MKVAENLPHVHLITGPTGTGKTEIATELAAAEDTPVVVADRIQCYVDMPATSARFTGGGPPRYHLSDRVVPDGDYPPDDAVHALLHRVQSLVRRHRYVVVEGGSLSLLRALADRRGRLPFRLTAQVIHVGDAAAHLERLRTRTARMLRDGMLQEFAQAWQYAEQRPFVTSVVGWTTLGQWCQDNGVQPPDLAGIERGGPEISDIVERVAQACAAHGQLQDATFTRLFEYRSTAREPSRRVPLRARSVNVAR